MSERSYLSIGEVLGQLQVEFPDVTISKIRFLESQGLIDPERTPSGYRKFYELDVERLRFILREQKEHFLPLKVIKDRLANGEPTGVNGEQPEVPADGATANGSEREPAWMAKSRERTNAAETPASPPDGGSLTADQLCAATGLTRRELTEVERYGLLGGRVVSGITYYDGDATACAGLAAVFLRYGVEPRHLRLYRNSVDREAALFEQVVLPLVKQRNPQARALAVETLRDLTRQGAELRETLLQQALRPYLEVT